MLSEGFESGNTHKICFLIQARSDMEFDIASEWQIRELKSAAFATFICSQERSDDIRNSFTSLLFNRLLGWWTTEKKGHSLFTNSRRSTFRLYTCNYLSNNVLRGLLYLCWVPEHFSAIIDLLTSVGLNGLPSPTHHKNICSVYTLASTWEN